MQQLVQEYLNKDVAGIVIEYLTPTPDEAIFKFQTALQDLLNLRGRMISLHGQIIRCQVCRRMEVMLTLKLRCNRWRRGEDFSRMVHFCDDCRQRARAVQQDLVYS